MVLFLNSLMILIRFRTMAENKILHDAFPGHTFKAYPDYKVVSDSELFPELYQDIIKDMTPRNIVFIALPDQMHYKAIVFALENDQHVLCVKPLTLKHDESIEIQKLAHEKGLFVGVEYQYGCFGGPSTGLGRLRQKRWPRTPTIA